MKFKILCSFLCAGLLLGGCANNMSNNGAETTSTISESEEAALPQTEAESEESTPLQTEEKSEESPLLQTEEKTEEVSDVEDKDLEKFATGMSEDISEQSEAANDIIADEEIPELTGDIEERCPDKITFRRDDVFYGKYEHATYFSTTCGMERGYSILLPSDYNEDNKYPVLYLLHGIFGDEYSFASDGANKINEIITNMAANGWIEQTIVVCPNMYATTDSNQKPSFEAEACLPYDNFINDLTTDLMPHIESTYSVATGRENTYLAGFSMGGRETIYITLKRPELFGYVCAISAAPGVVETKDKFMSHPGQIAEAEMKLDSDAVAPNIFILCCGTRDSVVGDYPKSYHEILLANNTEHIWYEITGADHDNNAIKSGIYNLFKQISLDKK